MAIIVPIKTEWDKKQLDLAIKDINKAKTKLSGLSTGTKQTGGAFDSLGGSIKKLGLSVAAVFGAREIGQFFSASIKGAIEDEKSLRLLNKTLENMGFRGATQQVDDFIGKLQYSAGIADDELRPALNNLVLATGNLSKSQELLQVSLDVSAGSGKDLDSITVALAKAYNGNFTALKKLNLGIDESLIKNKDLSGILSVLSVKFAGASANAVDTYAGKIKILQLAVGDAQEAIGYGFLNAVERVSKALGKDTGGLANSIKDIGDEIALVIEGVGVLTAEVITAANETEKSFKGLVATLFTEIFAGALTVPKWLIDFLTGKAKTARLEGPASASPAGSRLAQQAKKNQDALEKEAQAIEAAKKAQEELKKNTESLTETNINYAKFVAGTSPQSLEGATNLAREALGSIQKTMENHPKINDALVKSFRDLASVVQNNFSYALDQAKQKLDAAKQEYNNFKDSIKSSITGVMNFTAIAEGSTFLDNLTEQAKQAKAFGGQIQQLLTMGLNERAITQIANAGYEVGTVIADEIIAGGATVVQQVNTLVASVESVGEIVSTTLADQFKGAGVNAAQSLVDALISELNASAALIAQAIVNATQGGTTVVDTKPIVKELKPKVITQKTPTAASIGVSNKLRAMLPGRAVGGPVSSGLSYLVGERGPEIFMPSTNGNIVPNNKLTTSTSANINITVNAGMGASGASIGREIVDAIKKYERTSGPVFASA